jgi:hypothetical protein
LPKNTAPELRAQADSRVKNGLPSTRLNNAVQATTTVSHLQLQAALYQDSIHMSTTKSATNQVKTKGTWYGNDFAEIVMSEELYKLMQHAIKKWL